MSWLPAAEVSGRNGFAVALLRQQLDEPGLVLDFFVKDARRHIVRPRIFSERHVADFNPAANGAALRLQQQSQNIDDSGRIRQLRRAATGLIVEGWKVIRQFTTQLVNARYYQLPMGSVFETSVFTDLLVILVPGKMHSQDCVVVIGAGKFGGCIGNQHLDQLLHIDATRADHFNSHSLRNVARFHHWHILLLRHEASFPSHCSVRPAHRSKI